MQKDCIGREIYNTHISFYSTFLNNDARGFFGIQALIMASFLSAI